MKKILSLVLILALSISIVGCTSGDASLYDAFKNMQEVKAIESNTDISFTLEGEGLEEEEAMQLNQVASFINGMKLNLNGKSIGNDDNTAATSETQVNVEFMGMNIPFKTWVDVDLDKSEMKMIYQIPEMLLGFMGANPMGPDMANPLMGKEYLVYDMNEVMEINGEEIDYTAMMDFQKEFQPKMIQFMEDIQKELKLDADIIELKEEKEVDGEKIKVYRVHLNDESLREVVKDTVNYMLEDEATKEFIVEYMKGYIDVMKDMGLNDELSEEEMKEFEEELGNMEEDLDENLAKIKDEFNKFMDKYKDVKILGEDGINILYSVNKAGYIIEEDGTMDFSIDLEEMSKLQKREEQDGILLPAKTMKGKVNFKLNYNTKNSNINSKDLEVKMPELTPENSLDMQDLMDAQMEQLEKQMEMMEEFENMEIED